MILQVNGKQERLEAESASVAQILKELEVKQAEYVTVELNGEILYRQKYDTTRVKEGDKVEFLYFMGGGR